MSNHKRNRNNHVLSDLVNELFGPSEYHKNNFGTRFSHLESVPINIKEKIAFNGWDKVREANYRQADTDEEIVSGKDSPSVRYSIGILFSGGMHGDALNDDEEKDSEEEDTLEDIDNKEEDKKSETKEEHHEDEGDLDYELTTANQMLQSSAGLSFCISEDYLKKIKVKVTGGVYKPFNVEVNWKKNEKPKVSKPIWWARESLIAEFEDIYIPNKSSFDLSLASSTHEDFKLTARVFRKEVINSENNSKDCILTVVVMNKNVGKDRNKDSLFQTYFEILALDENDKSIIEPYPDNNIDDLNDHDGSMLKQMYSAKKVFAIGHGCSADWEQVDNRKSPNKLGASFLPVHEIPMTSPDVKNSQGEIIAPEMNLLASDDPSEWKKGLEQIQEVIDEYEEWINNQSKEKTQTETTQRMISECEETLMRMKDGFGLLTSNQEVKKVFRWANKAMYDQQIRPNSLRMATFNLKSPLDFSFDEYPKTKEGLGKWRAFQIAFLIMNLRSIIEPQNTDLRENVELIWFPTGGGKTEAYSGLAAFSILWRRLKDPLDDGTEVLMRYTLRLLTTQQYQRASSLICALDLIREENETDLGESRITLGLWIGGASSPNTVNSIKEAWKDITKPRFPKNNFVINQCPWCGAEMGIPRSKKSLRKNQNPLGYEKSGAGKSVRISFFCPDSACDFNLSRKLPLFVDDVSISEETPSMLIGTIDKLAMLAFESGNKNFPVFGRDVDGNQVKPPPGLIIQDELHLISGPLGSVAGVWEAVIENFCTDITKSKNSIKPKIVCSTATIRKYEEQILSLYGRTGSTLFPPPGLDSSDSFFGKQITKKGSGKLYVGVLAPSIGSALTAQTRVFTTLLQSPVNLPNDEKDPWYTLMLFFNSIRELGGAETLFQTDIADYRGAYLERHPGVNPRYPNERIRLTGELSHNELPIALERLSKEAQDNDSVDVCLATNILEVGVDIARLSLMAVVGQPKTTSTYIQATGRIGRDNERPGLVVTIYSPNKPRDRSHYEKFRTYHETLYSQVEPTSVTPFSAAALEKALHATFVAFVRLYGNQDIKDLPDPYPEDLGNDFVEFMEARANFIFNNQEYKDPDLVDNFNQLMKKRIAQWKRWQKQEWEYGVQNEGSPLLVRAGTDETASNERSRWLTMMNMRSVDATCKLKITEKYNELDDEDSS